MKLLILSDTHGDYVSADTVLDQNRDAAAVFFLGDGILDMEYIKDKYPNLTVYTVGGNCDYGLFAPSDGLVPFEGQLIYYTHGDQYRVKSTLHELSAAASARGAQIALFGHTHQPTLCEENGVTLFNPGSLSRFEHGGWYGILTLENGKPKFEHKRLP